MPGMMPRQLSPRPPLSSSQPFPHLMCPSPLMHSLSPMPLMSSLPSSRPISHPHRALVAPQSSLPVPPALSGRTPQTLVAAQCAHRVRCASAHLLHLRGTRYVVCALSFSACSETLVLFSSLPGAPLFAPAFLILLPHHAYTFCMHTRTIPTIPLPPVHTIAPTTIFHMRPYLLPHVHATLQHPLSLACPIVPPCSKDTPSRRIVTHMPIASCCRAHAHLPPFLMPCNALWEVFLMLLHIREIMDQIIGSLYIPADFSRRSHYLDGALEGERDDDGLPTEEDFQLEDVMIYLKIQNIAELLSNADMSRVSYYLHRIQRLYTNSEELTSTLVQLLSIVLKNQEPHGHLLPNLSQLFWHVKKLEIEEYFDMFGSPYITRLSMYPIREVSSAHLHFPNLVEVKFFNFWTDKECWDEYIADAITRLSPLRALDCFGYDLRFRAIYALSTMPALSRLRVAHLPPTVWVYTSSHRPPSRPFFPSLQELDIHSISPKMCHDLLRAFDNPRALRQLRVGLPVQEWTSADMETLLSCVGML
ncbi:hypothetical protein EVG20_g6909 [Dentipellis fragilis]|uniref:F-box domain-containing protein n=1 Tax=Dentipellis fragilis TaxID=205917 RepID=A0A4Y9YLH8_9AGAM|nr:hypothetical protein EVG20_g6909 [Dentipellis fragilis]